MKGICRSSKECAVRLMHFLLNHQFSFPGPIKQGAELEVKPVAATDDHKTLVADLEAKRLLECYSFELSCRRNLEMKRDLKAFRQGRRGETPP